MARFGFDDETTIARFDNRIPNQDQASRMSIIRDIFRHTAKVILDMTPPSADRTLALRWLRQAQAQANEAVMFPED